MSNHSGDAPKPVGISQWLLPAMVVLGVGAGLWFAGRNLGGYVPAFAEWVRALGVWGPVVFIVGYAVATVALVPGSLLTLAGGAVFGLFGGVA